MTRFLWPALLLLFLAGRESYAQQAMERVYADKQTPSPTQPLLSQVVNAGGAVDNNVSTHSILRANLAVLGLSQAWQNLRFTGPVQPSPNTPVTVKIGFGSSVLNLLGGITIQATLDGIPVGPAYTGSSLLGLLGGSNQAEVTFVPGTAYDGVRVLVQPILGLDVTADVYHAYFLNPAPGPVACDEVQDVLYGVGTYGLNAATVTGTVTDEWNTVDGDLDTYSTMQIGVQALAYIHQTVVYANPSRVGDSIRIVLSDPGGLLELELLTNFEIQAYLGNQAVGPLIDGSSDLLDIDLLGLMGSPGTKVVAAYAPPGVQFDRIQIRLGSAVGLLDAIRVHEVSRLAPRPVVSAPSASICEEDGVTLTVSNPEANAIYRWFDAPSGGNEITAGVTANGTSFEPGTLGPGTHKFYVSVIRNGCIEEASGRTEVAVTVGEQASAADVGVNNEEICEGMDAIFTPSSSLVNAAYRWYEDANKTQRITGGMNDGAISYAIAPDGTLAVSGLPEGTYTYYVSVSSEEKCENAAGDLKEGNVVVYPAPAAPMIDFSADSE